MDALPENSKAVKSLLISSIYYPPDVGGISKFMSSMVLALGPDRVCCLTGVRAQPAREREKPTSRVYRRPLAFAKPKHLQAIGWASAPKTIIDGPSLFNGPCHYSGVMHCAEHTRVVVKVGTFYFDYQ